MHVLIVETDRAQRERTADVLRSAAHKVTLGAGRAAALDALERETPDVVLVQWDPHAADLVQRIRAQESDSHRYVIATLGPHQSAAIVPALLAAGADDFLRYPAAKEEIVARVCTPLRFSRWASVVARQALDLRGDRDLRSLLAFRNMGDIVIADLAELVGPLDAVEGFLLSGEMHGATIPLSVPAEGAEIRVSVILEDALIGPVASLLLADPRPCEAAARDMIREITNTAGGAVKRAAELEKVQLTTGLPVDRSGTVTSEHTRCWSLRLRSGGGRLGLVGEVHRRVSQRLALGKAVEGMVVAEDLRNEVGLLILPAGSRLTEAAIGRAVNLLGARFQVEVQEAA